MAMQIAGASGAADPEPIMDINTTPLIDVMLVLLVMLIITIPIPIQLHAVNLHLPVGAPPPSDVKPDVVKIDIDPSSAVFWNGVAVVDRIELKSRLQDAAAQSVQPELHVRPDKNAQYKVFTEVMVDVHQAGLQKLGVVGSEQFLDDK